MLYVLAFFAAVAWTFIASSWENGLVHSFMVRYPGMTENSKIYGWPLPCLQLAEVAVASAGPGVTKVYSYTLDIVMFCLDVLIVFAVLSLGILSYKRKSA